MKSLQDSSRNDGKNIKYSSDVTERTEQSTYSYLVMQSIVIIPRSHFNYFEKFLSNTTLRTRSFWPTCNILNYIRSRYNLNVFNLCVNKQTCQEFYWMKNVSVFEILSIWNIKINNLNLIRKGRVDNKSMASLLLQVTGGRPECFRCFGTSIICDHVI